jgi:dihydrofolate reductase
VTFGCANSLDNFIAREEGSYDWILWDEEVGEIMKDYWPKIDTLVMGRKTYDVAKQGAPGSKNKKAKNPFGDIKTIVFSRTIEPGTHDGAEFTAEDPGKVVRRLKKGDGREICVFGGGEIGSVLLDAGVIDEIGFSIHPVLLGSGVPLFHKMDGQIDLELIECKAMKNGCVYVLYRVLN